MAEWLSSFDSYSKSIDGAKSRTIGGALVSIGSFFLMFCLFCTEFMLYQQVDMEDLVFVDPSGGSSPHIDAHFGLNFAKLPCSAVHIDMEDRQGTTKTSVTENITFTNSTTGGGCLIDGTLRLRKVAGEFHMTVGMNEGDAMQAAGRLFYHIDLESLTRFDASHDIRHLSFGPSFPGRLDPLDGFTAPLPGALVQYKYTINLVPTQYTWLNGTTVTSHQFSARLQKRSIDLKTGTFPQPGLFFKYDFSPIMVSYSEKRRTFLQFVTSACAILGGVFTVSSMVDSCMHRSAMALKKSE